MRSTTLILLATTNANKDAKEAAEATNAKEKTSWV
jgi:hypothetical protein